MDENKQTVDYELNGDIALIFLNRPNRLNAVVPELIEELNQSLKQAENDNVKAIILSGRGRAFCAGHDLKADTKFETEAELRNHLQRLQDVTRKIRKATCPVIAAVHGYALGAGCEFALCCDLIIADNNTEFGFPEVSVGLSVTGGISHLLPMTVGLTKAKELLLLGERFTAKEAKVLGLINFVVDSGELEEAAMKLAIRLSNLPQVSLSKAKFVLNHGSQSTIESAYELEVEHVLSTTFSDEAEKAAEKFKLRKKN
ncbi:enoyl-CoA hydratase/isomerase family protein [Virgibacillus necropolis]|uniref:enoyl-CoA hydratase/isomerase family protein n=1 Tax=Virgibacillus necropolis TaxID=163877 RepID=UPI00384F0DB6